MSYSHGREVGFSTYHINVVEVALASTGSDHLGDPAQALARRCAGSNSRESLLDGLFNFLLMNFAVDSFEVYYQRVNIFDVPRSGISSRNAVDIRFVQGEYGYRGQKQLRQYRGEELVKRHTCPSLSLPARVEVGDRARATIEAALHADEAETTVAVGRGWCIGFIVITKGKFEWAIELGK